jgi:two-component system sensor histidine kinase UhpB
VTLDNQKEAIEGLLQFATLVECERKLLAADLHDQTLSDLRELARLARRLADKPLHEISAEADRPFATRFACLISEDEISISEIEQLMLYRIIQEALNNISKHAAASSVEIVVKRLGHDMLIRVVDDGRGLIATGDLRRARGLDNMRYRARLIGAKLTWLRALGEGGTVVELRVPLRGPGR